MAKVYWCCMPRSVLQQGIDALAAAGDDTFFEGVTDAAEIPFAVPDERGHGSRRRRPRSRSHKDAAMRAHPTQILVDGPFFALSNNLGPGGPGHRVLPAGAGGARARPAPGPHGWEDDLFAGLAG